MAGQIRKHAQLEVGQRAHRERNAVLGQALHQTGVFAGLHAVVYALDLEHIQCGPDIGGGTFFTGMRHQMKAQCTAARKHPRKLLGRVSNLARIQPDANEFVPVGHGLLQRFKGIFFAQVTQKTHDEGSANTQFKLCIDTGAVQAIDDRAHADTPSRVGLGVKKQLGVNNVVCSSFNEVGTGHVVEVLLFQKHAGPCVVNVEKTLQVGKGVSATKRVNISIRKRHAVALGERKNQLRLQRAFNMNVQFCLRHAPEQFWQTVSGYRFNKKIHDNSKKRPNVQTSKNF